MDTPKISRPKFPKGYADNPVSYVGWEWVVEQMTASKNYWLSSVRPDGRPHVVPRWGVFIDNRFFYDGSPETRHAQNILENPNVYLHLESGDQVVMMEGVSKPAEKPTTEFAQQLAETIGNKYGKDGYSPKPDQWDEGGLYVFTPHQCIAWTVFYEDPTRFVFDG